MYTKELASTVVFKFQRGFYNEVYYDKCGRYPNVGTGEHIRVSPSMKKNVKLKGSVISNRFSLCSHSPSFDSFMEVTKEKRNTLLASKKLYYLLEINFKKIIFRSVI